MKIRQICIWGIFHCIEAYHPVAICPPHNDSKWASQFRQHGITAAALSTSKVKQSKVHLNLKNLLEFCAMHAQRNSSSMRHWKKPKKYHCELLL